MKKLLTGLLILAAGAGIYFFLLRKKDTPSSAAINKELIIGQWKTDAVMKNDSGFNRYRYDFRQNGDVVRLLTDSVKADTTHFEWNKNNELVWKEKAADSTGKIYTVTRLTTDSLQVLSADSVTILFTRVK